uniref:Uncharacterized protein n=1 Tax=Parascaris equorum TaxID=6256 RepID=A0A914RWI3_PAREQ
MAFELDSESSFASECIRTLVCMIAYKGELGEKASALRQKARWAEHCWISHFGIEILRQLGSSAAIC